MLIFWDKRLVFLATPKAGSTAVEVALESLACASVQRPAALKHTTARSYRDHIAPWLGLAAGGEFTTVALMREPIDWLRSWYRFRLRDDNDDPAHSMAGISFDDFVGLHAAGNRDMTAGFGSQADFLTDGGTRLVTHIFRYEDMDALTRFLEDRLDCEISLPRVNVPPSVDVTLSPETEAKARAAMAADIALYQSLT
ncbi:hypothetical protein [Paracoccus pacificus]|uniref:Sulfotransferase family protein n=1 Tax=Paracoccus pacificus TaxID=1463598 RepID=A0ABW4R9R8_9RHOB